MVDKIKIEIIGKNHEEISGAEFAVNTGDESVTKWLEDNKETVIKQFLIKMDKKGVVNKAIGASKGNGDISLWTPNFNGASYFAGVVGVIEDDLAIDLDSLTPALDTLKDATKLSLSIRLQIKSRFDTEKPYFLATMLLRDKIKLNDNMVLSNEDDLYDYMLLFWYKTKLLEAYEKGLYKTYRRFEANSERVKGAIDISRHIRLNAGQNNGKIATSYRENTINNYLNHLIVVAYEYLKKKYPELVEENIDNDRDLKAVLELIRSEIGYNPLDSRLLIKENMRPISHPYFMDYEDLRVICLKILRDEGISIWDAEDDTTKSILFYVPDLWELYLEDKIKENTEIGKDLYSQGRTPEGDTSIRVFGALEAIRNSDFKQPTYPDFVFFDGNEPYLILDAKFRKGWSETEKVGELTDYDKCIRDMNSLNAHATGVIYPTNEVVPEDRSYFDENRISHRISMYNRLDKFYTFPVPVPGTATEQSYTQWKRDFDRQLDAAMASIEEKVLQEKKRAKQIRAFMRDCPL